MRYSLRQGQARPWAKGDDAGGKRERLTEWEETMNKAPKENKSTNGKTLRRELSSLSPENEE